MQVMQEKTGKASNTNHGTTPDVETGFAKCCVDYAEPFVTKITITVSLPVLQQELFT